MMYPVGEATRVALVELARRWPESHPSRRKEDRASTSAGHDQVPEADPEAEQ